MSVLTRIRPVSLQGYKPSWLSRDVVAGVTLAAVAIPEAWATPRSPRRPVVTGLYSVIFPTIVFALLGSSRLLVVGADSATAAILAAGLASLGIAGLSPNSAEWVAWTSLVALVCGWSVGRGEAVPARVPGRLPQRVRADRVPHRRGYPGLRRTDPRHARDPEGQGELVRAAVVDDHACGRRQRLDASPSPLGTLAIILGFKRFLPKVPGAVVAVILSIILSSALDASSHGVAVIGSVQGGFPPDRAAGRDHLGRHPEGPRDRVLLLRADHRPERRDVSQLRDEARPARRREPRHRRPQRGQRCGRTHRHLRRERQPHEDPDPR